MVYLGILRYDWLFNQVTRLSTWVYDSYKTFYDNTKDNNEDQRYTMIMKGNTRMFETYMDLSNNNNCTNDVLWAIE